jgi:hypothetical protein
VGGSRDPLDNLPPGASGRLDRFAEAFGRLSANEYVLYATGSPDDPDLAAARAVVDAALASATRRAAVRTAVETFTDWAAQAYSRRLPATDTIMLYQSLPDRAEDRVRLLQGLERAVIAVILWDEIDAEVREILLGSWADMALRAVDA